MEKKRSKTGVFRAVKNAPDLLPCSSCPPGTLKSKKEFRIRVYKQTGIEYYSYKCKECEARLSREYYHKHKNDPVFAEKNRQRARDYATKNCDQIKDTRQTKEWKAKKAKLEGKRYHRKKDEINAKAKDRRKKPAYKKMMKAYREKNKDKIYKQEVITKRRYHEKNRDAITDKYVSNLLRTQGIAVTPQSIEIKRGQILLSRIKEKVRKSTKK